MNEFKTNPGKVTVIGNIANSTLRDLTDFTNFTKVKCALSSDGTRTVNGKAYPVMKMVYQP